MTREIRGVERGRPYRQAAASGLFLWTEKELVLVLALVPALDLVLVLVQALELVLELGRAAAASGRLFLRGVI